jgi:hypothetical protein
VMQTVLMGTDALYFHQGTIGNCEQPVFPFPTTV